MVDFCWICWFWNEKVIGGGYWGGWAFGKYRQAPHYRTGGEELVYFGWLCQDYGECLQLYHHHCAFTGSVIWGERYKKISGFLGQKWGKTAKFEGGVARFFPDLGGEITLWTGGENKKGAAGKIFSDPFSDWCYEKPLRQTAHQNIQSGRSPVDG